VLLLEIWLLAIVLRRVCEFMVLHTFSRLVGSLGEEVGGGGDDAISIGDRSALAICGAERLMVIGLEFSPGLEAYGSCQTW